MDEKARKHNADMLRKFANDVRHGRVEWVWICAQYTDKQRITYASSGAPKRPAGFS